VISWMWLTIILGGLSLDITAVGQFMISRPIVVGPLAGAVLGAPGIGLAVGALVELIWIGDLPVGAHMPIDNTLLAGVATYLAAEAVSRRGGPERRRDVRALRGTSLGGLILVGGELRRVASTGVGSNGPKPRWRREGSSRSRGRSSSFWPCCSPKASSWRLFPSGWLTRV
jgi:mannose/fructose/N-acetylgalactosamine-specific phosphotransferase system component IIC